MVEPPIELTAVEYRDRFLSGLTKPLLVGALDVNGAHRKVVLKLRNPEAQYGFGHYGGTSLACELICSVLARFLGLRVPDYAIVEVTSDFALSIPNETLRNLLQANLGENFGTVFHPSLALWQVVSNIKSQPILDQLEDILTFDATVINRDRKRGRPNLLFRGEELYLIDHSLALMICILDPRLTEECELFPDGEVYEHCTSHHLRSKGRGYCRITDKWENNVTAVLIRSVTAMVPHSWEENPGEIRKLSTFLVSRSLRCREIRMNLMRLLK